MFKKNLFLLIVIIALSGTVAFAGPSMGGEPVYGKIFLSNQEVSFTSAPFVINDEIMVPAKLFCEKLGAQVLWNEASREMISYRDNIFIKFKNNSSLAHVNGKPKTMPVSSFTFKGELYIPASFAAAAHELAFETESTSHALSIDFRENILEYRQIGFRHFKRISLTNYGISFYIPEYWSEVADKVATYGVENSFESYAFEANVMTLNPQYTRPILTESILEGLTAEHGDALNLVSSNTMVLGDYTSDAIYYDITLEGVTTHHSLYIFFEQNNGYVFKATYPDTNDLEESREIFDTIASTFSITKLTVNEQL
ncbi:MAG TPA: copper amine oxidase N-terminal domain-containing protein, partial [Fusibacter sp.]|nr:copper amine oxidase N-terminal domain-containing protein [Fusibacter sp.]